MCVSLASYGQSKSAVTRDRSNKSKNSKNKMVKIKFCMCIPNFMTIGGNFQKVLETDGRTDAEGQSHL